MNKTKQQIGNICISPKILFSLQDHKKAKYVIESLWFNLFTRKGDNAFHIFA